MFGAVRYINLEHRKDRKDQIEAELHKMGIENFKRFPAVKEEFGALGCLKSHLNLLKEAKDKKFKNILILEDDFEFLLSKEDFWKLMESVKDLDYDVLLFGYNNGNLKSEKVNDVYSKVLEAQTTSAYLVNEKFYDTFIKTFEECLKQLVKTQDIYKYPADQCWKTIQPQNKWYVFHTRVGKQRKSFSNVAKINANYQTGGASPFGAVRYINLEKRTDRKKEIESELRRMGIENFKRFPAVNHEKTEIGCFLSHLNLLKEARDKKHKNVLVLEDDFEFVVSKEDFWKFMNSIKDLDYDVIMFVYNTQAHEDFNDNLIKVKSAQTAAGYLVNSKFYDALIENFEEALPKFIETGEHWHYANDQCWKSLQPHSKWYAFRPSIGKVRASYSDIQGKQTNDYRSTIGGSRRSKTRKSKSRRKMVRRKRTRTR